MSHMLLEILGMEDFCLVLLWGCILIWGYEDQQKWQAYLHRKHLGCRIIVGNKQMYGCLPPIPPVYSVNSVCFAQVWPALRRQKQTTKG